jgi:hypothetical protein
MMSLNLSLQIYFIMILKDGGTNLKMFNKDKLSFLTRIKLCWEVLTRGEYDPRNYRTRHLEKQWQICEKRRKELEACTRPRTEYAPRDDWLGQ